MRRIIYCEKHFKCDNLVPAYWQVPKAYMSTGNGFAVDENYIKTDDNNNIVSHCYHDVLPDEKSLEKFHLPVITAYPDADKQNMDRAEEIFNGILPVRLTGHGIYYAPWDTISRLRGVDNILIDIYDNPEHLHNIIRLFTEAQKSEMEQMEKLGLYDGSVTGLHCTPGDVTVTNPSKSGCCCQDIWFRTMAQTFGSVSPAVHYEFDMQYSIPLAEKCAYTYYGCCEALYDRIDYVKKYKNLRKIGVSPWSDVEKTAEQIGGEYVLSRKPNPANVSISTDANTVRKEITETVKACIKYGCPCDITLKDISTVNYRPENLFIWAETASKVLDEYYGEE